MGIGKVLKQLIKENGSNVNELAEKVDVSPQTLYSIIKRDNMKADLDVLCKICDFYSVDVTVFYSASRKGTPSCISREETELIENFRSVNEEGKEKISEYARDVAESPRYEKKNINELDTQKQA